MRNVTLLSFLVAIGIVTASLSGCVIEGEGFYGRPHWHRW